MSKFLVETHYTCTFKIVHELDELNEKELSNIDSRKDGKVEVIGGPFQGMKATITRVDHDKEEATVILLDAPYQLPVTVDANYLKPSSA